MTHDISDSDNSSPADGTRIRSVVRAARVLAAVAEREGCTASELAASAGLPLATCYHLLRTLVGEGLLDKDTRRQYHLGPAIGSLSDAFVRRLATPEPLMRQLRRLAENTGETAVASAWRNGEVTVLAAVEGRTAVRVAGLYSGYAAHAHARSAGKLLLALAQDRVRDAYLDRHPLDRLTGHTIVQRSRLVEELIEIRARGYAVDREEFREGVACVSAPVLDHDIAWAALTVSAPVERFERRRKEFVDAVLAAARAISTGTEVSRGVRGA
jgi:DNA-binding IclR family transcriptional regulator